VLDSVALVELVGVVEQDFWVQHQQVVDQVVDLEAMVATVALLDWVQLVKDLLVHLGLEQLT
jgi:hypothetical protein